MDSIIFKERYSILVEEYSYSLALKAIKAQGVETIGVPMDVKGILPEAWEKCWTTIYVQQNMSYFIV